MNCTFEKISVLELFSQFQSRREFVGPRKPISDYRLAAGLLFPRWNDGTTRVLICRQNELPQIEIGWHSDFSLPSEGVIPIMPEAVDKLIEERVIDETRRSYFSCRRFVLNNTGKRLVVTEWFSGGADFYDYMSAGATYDTVDQKMRW